MTVSQRSCIMVKKSNFLGGSVMAHQGRPAKSKSASEGMARLPRALGLTAQTEQVLRQAIADGLFPDGQLPTEVDLAEQLGVSRETVRLATETLQREGLLVKIRRRGTFLQPPAMPTSLQAAPTKALVYLQAGYPVAQGSEEAATQAISALMLQGAVEEAGEAGFHLIVQHAAHTRLMPALLHLHRVHAPRGVIFASCGEEKLLKRALGLGIPILLLDHDLHLPNVHSVRDDSFAGAEQAVHYLANLGHRHIALAYWQHAELNPWRLRGFRHALRNLGLTRRKSWEEFVELTEIGARQFIDKWQALRPRPTAIYSFNNTLARHIIAELFTRGLKVPGDVSVLGGGGEEVQGLTCHQADWFAMGKKALQILLEAMTPGASGGSTQFLGPHTLRIGQTTRAEARSPTVVEPVIR